ncbi:DnaJ-like protein [Vibrio cholerae]|nr:DnaJ-like protein [Vibrio cholerae]
MNALYQLQETLHPEKWLQVEAMNIILTPMMRSEFHDSGRDIDTQWAAIMVRI